ncbi:response regulator [Streptomyces boninensis]|uniref:response regulator n=1 Tax=Streptomyces boninensis TaxID=2039455 RepID=UPI003B228C75
MTSTGSVTTPAAAAPVRIVIADDHEVVRAGFAGLLDTQPDFTVVGVACDGAEALRVCARQRPDVVLMDVRMPEMDGIAATAELVGADDGSPGGPSGRPRILILTTFDLDEHVYDALAAGASGFLLKDVTAEKLFEAVRVVAAGQALLAPTVTQRLVAEFARQRRRAHARQPAGLPVLTARETEVIKQVAQGLSNPEIATRLYVSEETVKTHISRILAKLGLRDRTQAVVAAYESGLVVPGAGGGAGEGET